MSICFKKIQTRLRGLVKFIYPAMLHASTATNWKVYSMKVDYIIETLNADILSELHSAR